MEACQAGNAETVEFLLDHGADPNRIKEGYRYPLLETVRKGDLQIVNLLLEHGADIRRNDGEVFGAAMWGRERVISRLLEHPMTPTEREAFLDRALQEALYYCKLEMCTWLLDQGANLHAVGGKYGSPLQAAVSNGQVYTPADVNNKRLILTMLIEKGVNINNLGGKPPALMMALDNRSRITANMLLDAGADVNLGGGADLHSPLQAACRRQLFDVAERLLQAGADVNARGGTYGSPLHATAYTHDLAGIKLLMDHGANSTVHDVCGKYGSVIQAAAKENAVCNGGFLRGRDSVRAMELLRSYGASPTARGGKYGCALQMAAKSNNFLGVRWLLAHGADPAEEIDESKYKTALNAARKKEHYDIVSLLEQHLRDRGRV